MPITSTARLKLDTDTKKRLQRLASARRRTLDWVMQEAIEQYLDREKKRELFRESALAAWAHYESTGLHVTAQKADAWLSKLEAGSQARPHKSGGTETDGGGSAITRDSFAA